MKNYTVAEVSKKLGISRDKVNYQVRKLPPELTTLLCKGKKKTRLISSEGLEIIAERAGVKNALVPSETQEELQELREKVDILIRLVQEQGQKIDTQQKMLDSQKKGIFSRLFRR